MAEIILVSTIHKEIGNVNAHELCSILEIIQPDVIFLEALESSYTEYDKMVFDNFNVYSKKLELKAIQLYSLNKDFEYIPVLDNGMSDVFNKKYKLICENKEFQNKLNNFDKRASQEGFSFLNSETCQLLQKEMREYEDKMILNHEINSQFNDLINEYEDSMIRNIQEYCQQNSFPKAVFMCGVAHRKSVLEKLNLVNNNERLNVSVVGFN